MKKYTCGIYKITNPKGRVYIGQSISVEKRWQSYRGLHCQGQSKLYNSFIKHGVEKHIFEIIHECEREELNKLELYYQEIYCSLGAGGMNCCFVDLNGNVVMSPEMRKKIGLANKGKAMSEETKRKISEKAKGRINNITPEGRQRIIDTHKGKKYSVETRAKISAANLGKKITDSVKEALRIKSGNWYHSNPNNPLKKYSETCIGKKLTEEHKMKCSIALTGRKHSEETKKRISEGNTGKVMSKKARENMSKSNRMNVLVVNLETGIYYDNITKAAASIGKQKNYLVNRLSGETINQTSFIRA